MEWLKRRRGRRFRRQWHGCSKRSAASTGRDHFMDRRMGGLIGGRWLWRSERRAKLVVVRIFLERIEQSNAGAGDLVQQSLRVGGVCAKLVRPHMEHLPVGSVFDDVEVRLKKLQPEQPVKIGWLLGRRNSEPGVVGVKTGFGNNEPATAAWADN